jgi:DNA-binding HxlR family transcriptional regulator
LKLTVVQVKERGRKDMRAGTHALSLLATPLNTFVLQALAEGPRSLVDLRCEVGCPPQTTMRGHLRNLNELGVVTRRRQNDFPGSLDYELDDPGRELLIVAEVLQSWLAVAPEGPLPFGSIAAKSAIKALVDGWATSMLRALAARPLSLTELDDLISGVSYPSLERRLAAMRQAGLVEARKGRGRGTPYAVSEWTRQAVASLTMAARWEQLHLRGEGRPITNRDAETVLLLATPLLRLGPDASGSCRLAVRTANGEDRRLVGVMVEVEEGRIASCVSRLEGKPSAWAVGPLAAWLAAVLEHDAGLLEVGGGHAGLAVDLVEGLHQSLFGSAAHR